MSAARATRARSAFPSACTSPRSSWRPRTCRRTGAAGPRYVTYGACFLLESFTCVTIKGLPAPCCTPIQAGTNTNAFIQLRIKCLPAARSLYTYLPLAHQPINPTPHQHQVEKRTVRPLYTYLHWPINPSTNPPPPTTRWRSARRRCSACSGTRTWRGSSLTCICSTSTPSSSVRFWYLPVKGGSGWLMGVSILWQWLAYGGQGGSGWLMGVFVCGSGMGCGWLIRGHHVRFLHVAMAGLLS